MSDEEMAEGKKHLDNALYALLDYKTQVLGETDIEVLKESIQDLIDRHMMLSIVSYNLTECLNDAASMAIKSEKEVERLRRDLETMQAAVAEAVEVIAQKGTSEAEAFLSTQEE